MSGRPTHGAAPQVLVEPTESNHRTTMNYLIGNMHTVDGRNTHKAPGSKSKAKHAWKARNAKAVFRQLYERCSRLENTTWVLAGDLNVSTMPLVEAFRDVPVDVMLVNEMNVHFICEAVEKPRNLQKNDTLTLPDIKGPDNQHDVLWVEMCIDARGRAPPGPPPRRSPLPPPEVVEAVRVVLLAELNPPPGPHSPSAVSTFQDTTCVLKSRIQQQQQQQQNNHTAVTGHTNKP